MQQAVDAFLDLDEGAVVGQVADLAGDDRAGRVLLGDQGPGVGLGLLHAQADFLLVLVDLQDDDVDLVADVDHLAGVVDAPGPGHLGDVHQALDAFLQLHERAVGHDVDHLPLTRVPTGYFVLDVLPRAGPASA